MPSVGAKGGMLGIYKKATAYHPTFVYREIAILR